MQYSVRFARSRSFYFCARAIEKISDVYDEMINNRFHGFFGKTDQFTSAGSAASIEIRIKRIVIFFALRLKEKDESASDQSNSELFLRTSFIRIRKTLKTATIYGGWSSKEQVCQG